PGSTRESKIISPGRKGREPEPGISMEAFWRRRATAGEASIRSAISRVKVAALWAMAKNTSLNPTPRAGVVESCMFRWALLLSFTIRRSVVGQPGVLPTRLGGTNGSLGDEISTARQRWLPAMALRCQCTGVVIVGPTSTALKTTVGSGSRNATSGSPEEESTYWLPV